jgi:hypothetical protein
MRGILGAGLLAVLGVIAVEGCGQQAPVEQLGKQQQAISTGLVISAISGGTGYYKGDYVEIFNRGATAIPLTGITLQYSRSDYRTWSTTGNVVALSGTIPAGGYYLVRLATNTTAPNDLPTPDLIQPAPVTNYATGAALVALVTGTTPLDCGPAPPITVDGGPVADPDGGTATPCTSATIIDFVGYGVTGATPAPAPVYEGSGAAPTGTNPNVLRRKGNGCQDTDNNSADFESVAHSTTVVARNSATAVNVCATDAGLDAAADVLDTAVVDVAVDAPVDAPVDVPADSPADSPADTKADAPTDTGTAPTDTGTTPEDTGSTSEDTGVVSPPVDTGTAVVDTGAPQLEEVTEDEGCGCRVAGGERAQFGASLVGLFFALGAIARRRKK